MQVAFEKIMQSVCHQALLEEYQAAKEAPARIDSVKLEADDIARLSNKIALLPVDDRTILFCRYCFGFSAKDTQEAFALENAAGQLRYLQNMLAFFMGIEEAKIDDSSFHKAAQLALESYTTRNDAIPLLPPKYSARFRRKLQSIKAAQRLSDYILLAAKRVAVFLLVCTVGFSTVLAIHAQAREQFFALLVETFPQFSVFIAQPQDETTITMENFERVEVQYVPKGFVLNEKALLRTRVIYKYSNDSGERIFVTIAAPSRDYLDTEDADVKQMEFKGNTAYYWTKDNTAYIVWQQDGLSCNIIARCSMEQAIKIAENIIS